MANDQGGVHNAAAARPHIALGRVMGDKNRVYTAGEEIHGLSEAQGAQLRKAGTAANPDHPAAKQAVEQRAARLKAEKEAADAEEAARESEAIHGPMFTRMPASLGQFQTQAHDHVVIRNGSTVGDVSVARAQGGAEASPSEQEMMNRLSREGGEASTEDEQADDTPSSLAPHAPAKSPSNTGRKR
jgi:hypothetical protein